MSINREQLHTLISQAFQSRDRAYAPYSNFRVGAAILMENDKLFGGCNVENASYGGAICAERTAICKAVSEGYRQIKAVVVVSDVQEPTTTPCGICRQFVREFAQPTTPIYVVSAAYTDLAPANETAPDFIVQGPNGAVIDRQDIGLCFTLDELLPHSFGPQNLLV